MASIPLYLINGFLEAGKTTFLEDVLLNGDFADGQKTLLILCEEGEVEYNQSALTNLNMLSLTVDEEQQFSASFLNDCVKQIRLGRLERQRRSALAACSAEQDAEKKHILLQKIDELGKKIHKLKTSF